MSEAEASKKDSDSAVTIPENGLVKLMYLFKLAKTGRQAVFLAAFLFSVVTFLPLFVLSVISGTEFGGRVEMPVYKDSITLTRDLLVAPILILSDLAIRPWMAKSIERFESMIAIESLDSFKTMVARVFAVRNSMVADVILLTFSFVLAILGTGLTFAIDASSWHIDAATGSLTPAGCYNAFFSQPLFRFIVMSWIFDYILWVYFLFRVSSYRLKVIATHPDGVGGLSFIRITQAQYGIAAFALSCAVCGVTAQAVHYLHMKLESFADMGLLFLVLMLIVFAGPLLAFTPQLLNCKMSGTFTYGKLVGQLNRDFAGRWLGDEKTRDDKLIDTGDPSALADMNGGYEAVMNMRPVLFDRTFLVGYIVVICLPALPLVASVIPLKSLLKQIFDALM